MSTLDAACYTFPPEKEGGAGEMNLSKSRPSTSASSHTIATEILNDIVDNVFEVVMSKNLQPAPKVEKITTNVVGDILDNILSPSTDDAVPNEDQSDDMTILDEEIKKIIREMKYPPEERQQVSTKGIGDQLGGKSEVSPDKILSEPTKRNTLERKNRLTNLVRTSKQMFTKLVSNDTENELRMTKSEEIHEKVLKVIDLQGDDHYIEAGSSSTTGILRMPRESSLHTIDLKTHAQSDGEQVERVCTLDREGSKKSACSSKKKPSLGSRILKFLRRNKDSQKE